MTTDTLREPCDDAKLIRQQLSYDPETGQMKIARTGKGLVYGRVVGCVNNLGYVHYRFNGKTQKLHRLAWLHFYGHWPQHHIDHINGIKTDNRIANLRDVPRYVNVQNRSTALSTSQSKVLGVYFKKDKNRWGAHIRFNGQKKHLGYFKTIEAASDAYLTAKRELHEGCTI